MRFPFVVPTFFFYVLWLLAVPMEGPLLINMSAAGGSRYFIFAHLASLLAIAHWGRSTWLRTAAITGSLLAAMLTMLLFSSGASTGLLMTILGIAAAPVAVKTCNDLHSYFCPVRVATLSLVGANVLLWLMHSSSGMPIWNNLAILLPLLTLPGLAALEECRHKTPTLNRSYLAFVFIFQIISGLMYAILFPVYALHTFMPGLELPFYMAAALLAVKIYQHDRDLLLICGLTLAMAAFALLQFGGTLAVNLSLYAMQAAAGCIDVFLLSLMLASARSYATFGYGLAVLCGGIAAGQILSLALGSASAVAGLAGSLILNVAALALVFHKHRHPSRAPSPPETTPPSPPALPGEISCQLSDREINVLTRVFLGKNYRETALELAISESSVKTYMKRICDKLGVANRLELLTYLNEECQHSKS